MSRLGAEIVAAAKHNHSLVESLPDQSLRSGSRSIIRYEERPLVRLFAFDECKYILESINAFDQVSQQAGQQQQAWGECIDFFSEMKKSKKIMLLLCSDLIRMDGGSILYLEVGRDLVVSIHTFATVCDTALTDRPQPKSSSKRQAAQFITLRFMVPFSQTHTFGLWGVGCCAV